MSTVIPRPPVSVPVRACFLAFISRGETKVRARAYDQQVISGLSPVQLQVGEGGSPSG